MNRNALAMTALAAGVALGTSQLAAAANGTWSNTSGGLWDTDSNWDSLTIADGSGNTANFNTLDITALTTVSLNSPRTIGNLIFGDTTTSSAASWVLNNNANAANILTLAGTTPTITVNALGTNALATISAVIAGNNGLVKDGTGTTATGVLVLSGANTYSGTTTISNGSLRAQNNSALGTSTVTIANGARLQLHAVSLSNTINLNGTSALFRSSGDNTLSGTVNVQSNSVVDLNSTNNGTLTLSGTLNLVGGTLSFNTTNGSPATISAAISGADGITKNNDGRLIITNNNSATYSGTTTVTRGVLEVGHNAALGTGTLAFAVGNDTNGTIRSSDTTTRTIANAMTMGGGNTSSRRIFGSTTAGFNGDLTFTNTTSIALSGLRRLEVHNTTQFEAGFTGASGSILMQTGTGTLIMNGDSTYAGTTTINAGTLLLNGTHTGGGAYTVGAAGALGGIGSTASSVTVNGIVDPGNSLGTLSVGAATFADNSILSIELGAAGASDRLAVTGALDLDSLLDTLALSGAADGSSYTIATYGSLSGTFNTVTGVPENYVLDYGSGTNSAITLTLIPEPGSLALASLAGLLMLKRRRYD